MRTASSAVRSLPVLQRELTEALIDLNEGMAERILNEAFSLYTVEEVGENLILPVLVEIGARWHNGEVSITREHYATEYLRQRLIGLIRSVGSNIYGPIVWLGCAPGEMHEIGTIMLCIYLRRAGFQTRYLGQNLPVMTLLEDIQLNPPKLILFSASTRESGQRLKDLTQELAKLTIPGLVVEYGGSIFNQHPELRSDIAGIFFGSTGQEAVDTADEILRQ